MFNVCFRQFLLAGCSLLAVCVGDVLATHAQDDQAATDASPGDPDATTSTSPASIRSGQDASVRLASRDHAYRAEASLAMIRTSEDVEIELVTAEPHVVDPVAARFDSTGRLWIVEMRDYPTGPADGGEAQSQIRILRDADGDGVYNQSVVFAEQLNFPTGIQPWRDGVIVTLAGQIVYLADTDGDDRCDHQETWFSGFARSNTQLRVNHPILGVDGLVYVAGGLRSSTVQSADPRWPSRDQPLKLTHCDFVFDPNGGHWGPASGESQHGLCIGDFGSRIGVSNRNPAKLAVLPFELVQHDPWLSPTSAVVDISPAGGASEVRPIAEAWTTSNLHAGQFSAACGVHQIAASAMPPDWQGDLLTCEPTAYLVQRADVDYSGAVPEAQPVFNPGEAVASTDAWFRPVDVIGGPDGGIYLVDMHRAVIEHPEWAPTELKQRVDERWGDECGRIFRLVARDHPSQTSGELPPASELPAWARLLDHPNRWHREQATRRFVEALGQTRASGEGNGPAAMAVRSVFTSLQTAEGLSRAVHLMAYAGDLRLDDVRRLAEHDDARLRGVAAQLAVARPDGAPLGEMLAARLLSDRHPAVRLSASVALASAESRLGEDCVALLADAVSKSTPHPAMILALGAVAAENAAPLLHALLPRLSELPLLAESGPESAGVLLAGRLVRRIAATDPDAEPSWLNLAAGSEASPIAVQLAARWAEGLKHARRDPSDMIHAFSSAEARQWDRVAASAVRVATDPEIPSDQRVAAIDVVSLSPSGSAAALRQLRTTPGPAAVRIAAMEACAAANFDDHLAWLSAGTDHLPWEIARRAVQVALRRPAGQRWTLDAIAEDRLARGLMPPADAQRLLQSRNPEIAARAQQVWTEVAGDRQLVIEDYHRQMPEQGDAVAGQQLFRKHCAACHRIADTGFHVGPDISDSRTQTPQSLLASILDPSRAIDAGFVGYSVVTVDGRLIDGLLIDDRPDAVTLKISGGESVTIPRDEIDQLANRGVSLMPSGFEQLLPPDEMADLVAYLKNWRYLK